MKYIQIIAFLVLCPMLTFAQEERPAAEDNQDREVSAESDDTTTAWEFVKEKIFFGGTGGASFGNVTYINVSPLTGLRLTPNFAAGVGGTYIYYKSNYFNISTSVYGGRLFSRYYFLEKFIAHGEYELLNAEFYNENKLSYERKWTPALPLGGGIRQSLGRRGHIEVLLLMDLLYKPSTSIYESPFRLNFGIIF
ncbi:MAG: hypothetical protein WD077_11420 [Bacteroidia bacterium]